MSHLPYHLSEDCFRKYELTICAAVNRYPEVVKIKASDMGVAPTTFAARLRDALESHFKNEWKSQVPWNRFKQIRKELIVSHRGNIVFLGTKEAIKGADCLPEQLTPITIGDEVTIQIKTLDQLLLLCDLSVSQCFSKRLKVFGVNSTDAEHCQKHYDVAFKLLPDGSHLLL